MPPRSTHARRSAKQCTLDYLAAVRNPFLAKPACLPYPPGNASETKKLIQHGTMTIGTDGYGYVTMCPVIETDNAEVNEAYAMGYTTNSTYFHTTVSTVVGVPTGSAKVDAYWWPAGDAPDLLVGYPAGQQVRTVARSIRIRNISPEGDIGGEYLCIRHPANEKVESKTWDELRRLSNLNQTITSDTRDWVQVDHVPFMEQEMYYHDPSDTHVAGVPYKMNDESSLCIMVRGKAGNTFAVEWAHHVELCGLDSIQEVPVMTSQSVIDSYISLQSHLLTGSRSTPQRIGSLNQAARRLYTALTPRSRRRTANRAPFTGVNFANSFAAQNPPRARSEASPGRRRSVRRQLRFDD